LGHYINADEIEAEILRKGILDLANYGISKSDAHGLNKIITEHSIYKKAINDGFGFDLEIDGTIVHNPNQKTHSYEASLLSDIIRNVLLKKGSKFSFETVMSHGSKIDFLKNSTANGYRNYLYFISTESPLINIERVKQRVKLGGHPVDKVKIEDRYYRSLELLSKAVANTYRTFIFDNSKKAPTLILEIYKGSEVEFKHNLVPAWVDKYVLQQ
tara:strand:+ start:979 stop:1620 length:642 start_codon:yes stop_codon:yes gene_type:complete